MEEIINFFKTSPEDIIIDFREKGGKGERKGEKHQRERETLVSCLLYVP